MNHKLFRLVDFMQRGKSTGLIRNSFVEKLKNAVCDFCKDKKIISITGDPSIWFVHNASSSDDGYGWDYRGGYTVWYIQESNASQEEK